MRYHNQGISYAFNPFRYRGHRFDEATGLYYIYGRFYSPVFGRFISPRLDYGTIGNSISHNLYAFALNNPIMNAYGIGAFGGGVLHMTIPFIWVVIAIAFLLVTLYMMWQLERALWDIGFEIDQLARQIGSAAISFGHWLAEILNQVMWRYMHTTERTNWHVHHIVAKTALQAHHSRWLFNMHFGPNSHLNHPLNLVAVRASLHAHLHSSLYHQWVANLLHVSVFNVTDTPPTWQSEASLSSVIRGIARTLQRASISAP